MDKVTRYTRIPSESPSPEQQLDLMEKRLGSRIKVVATSREEIPDAGDRPDRREALHYIRVANMEPVAIEDQVTQCRQFVNTLRQRGEFLGLKVIGEFGDIIK